MAYMLILLYMEEIIKQYANVPYFNNKTTGRRGALRVHTGKGDPIEIENEIFEISHRKKIDYKSLGGVEIKKLLVENNIGIECSGFAYHVLNEKFKIKDKGEMKSQIKFPYVKGVIGKIRTMIRPVENIDVKTFAHDENSSVVELDHARVGDIITMTKGAGAGVRDHILIINQIELEDNLPKTLYYVHAVAWPTDGEYGTGIHKGKIEITNLKKSILEQDWEELEKTGEENYTFARAKKSVTELRRLNCLMLT